MTGRLRARFAGVARWLHVYTSMLSLAAVLFFSITGITLNHPTWLFGTKSVERTLTGTLPAEWLAAPVQQLRIAEHLRGEFHLRGLVDEFLEQDDGATVAFKGPGYSADVFCKRSGEFEITERSEGAVAFLNDLHKGRHTGGAWSLVIDISAVVLIVVSATGLILLFYIKRRRMAGIAIGAIGMSALVLVAWLLSGR